MSLLLLFSSTVYTAPTPGCAHATSEVLYDVAAEDDSVFEVFTYKGEVISVVADSAVQFEAEAKELELHTVITEHAVRFTCKATDEAC